MITIARGGEALLPGLSAAHDEPQPLSAKAGTIRQGQHHRHARACPGRDDAGNGRPQATVVSAAIFPLDRRESRRKAELDFWGGLKRRP
jgi:hypothetical protein